ncbi:MAG: vWA domain-containing protein [Hyphomicrobiales bacterium]
MTAQDSPIAARVVGFVDHLRMNDFAVGIAETRAAVDLLTRPGFAGPELAHRGLKVLLTGRRDEWTRFDDLFEAYWYARGRERGQDYALTHTEIRSNAPGRRMWQDHLGQTQGHGAAEASGDGETELSGDASGRVVATDRTTRSQTDLRQFTDPQEIAEAERLAYRLARAMRHRLTRRHRPDKGGTRLDMRRMIRANLRHGGEPITLVHTAPPHRPVRLVVFLDVSGSMKPYSRFFLQFVKGLVCTWLDADAYLFHTRLIRVTDAIRERDSAKAMTRLALMADGFGGGTKLGASIARFNEVYAKRALNSRSVVVVLSDGYDTGRPEVLARELGRLKRRARRLVWLNPLLGWRDYAPVTAAMTAAMPHIDHFAPANTLASLAAIEADLRRL